MSIAEKEVQRRAAQVEMQANRLSEAGALFEQGKTAAAFSMYEDIYTQVPNIPQAQEIRTVAREGYLHSGLRRVTELLAVGDYPNARKILDALDSPNVAKGRPEIANLRARMNDPDRYPPALTPKHVENVEEVQRLLTLGASEHETGMYDKALTTYESVLRIDPANTAARRGMERVENERTRYFESARDHQRGRMLNEINSLWEDKPRLKAQEISELFSAGREQLGKMTQKGGRQSILSKLRDIKIERIDFTSAALDEVLEYLRVRSRDLDTTGSGIDFVNGVPSDQLLRPVSLNLINVPIEEVLRYVTEVAGVSYRVEEYAVRIVQLSDTNQSIISKSYRVPPDFITSAPSGTVVGAAPAADPFTPQAAGSTVGTIMRRLGAKEFLESRGINFPEGTGASYNPIANLLIVRNNAKNIELVDSLVEQSLNTSPKMAVIEVKMIEVNQTKLEELGFDWLLEGFGTNVQLGGGTVGNAQTSSFVANEFPANAGLSSTGLGPVTAGLRSSGDLATNRTIEDLLVGSVQSSSRRSPGVLSLSGVLTSPQFQVVMRALDQKTGVDLVSRPSVVSKSGQKASVEIVRELIYPTEFDPPQIPTNIGGGNNIIIIINGIVQPPPPLPPIPVTPTTPTAFATRPVGTILEVEPLISENGKEIDLTITPQVTEFIGFVNYGTPIRQVAVAPDAAGILGLGVNTELTPNIIYQPIFSSKKIVTSVKVYDGATVVLGGLITDQSIMINDKVPVIGDLPIVGRLFQSKVKQRRMKNMLFFVTVKVIDPSGNRINPDQR